MEHLEKRAGKEMIFFLFFFQNRMRFLTRSNNASSRGANAGPRGRY